MRLDTDSDGEQVVRGVHFLINRTGLYLVTDHGEGRGAYYDHLPLDPADLPEVGCYEVCCHPDGANPYQGDEEGNKATLDVMAEWNCDPAIQYEWFDEVVPFEWIRKYIHLCSICGEQDAVYTCHDDICDDCCAKAEDEAEAQENGKAMRV